MIGEEEGVGVLIDLIIHVEDELRGEEGFIFESEVVNLLCEGLVEHHGNRRMEIEVKEIIMK